MDVASLAQEALEVVGALCGDSVVESHEQAARVLEVMLKKPGRESREFAAVLNVTPEQLARCVECGLLAGREASPLHRGGDAVYTELCWADAVYTLNMLMQRVNQVAHWTEEFQELRDRADGSGSAEEEDVLADMDDATSIASDGAMSGGAVERGANFVATSARAKAVGLLAKRLEAAASQALRQRLAMRLEEEIFEQFPDNGDYRCCVRDIAANLRRNLSLAAAYSDGRVPPQWLVRVDIAALAPRLTQLQRRALRTECMKEALCDDETAELKHQANLAGKATDLAPPPPFEDPLG